MKRALVALALLWSTAARATEYWQDEQNTGGFVSVVSPPAGSCFLYETAPFDVQCYTTIPASFIGAVPTGVLEGVGGAISGYSATANLVQYGAASGGGLQQSSNLQFDGTTMSLGAHTTSPIETLSTADLNSTLTFLVMYPGSGTNVGNIVRVEPRGTGAAGNTAVLQLWNTDPNASPNTELLSIQGRGSGGFVIVSSKASAGTLRPIAIGTDAGPVQLVCATSGDVQVGAGNVVLNKTGAQAVTHSAGTMTVGTTDANALVLETNGSSAVSIDTSQLVTLPAYASAGTQCAQFDPSGKLGGTGVACGTGSGTSGITQLVGDGTAGPGSGTQTFTLHNIPTGTTAPGDIVFTPIAAPATPGAGFADVYVDSTSKNLAVKNDAGAVNHGAQTAASSAGIALTGLSDTGLWTTQAFQTPIVACTNYVSLSCVTGATDLGGSNATPTVIGVESDAAMRGDILATAVAAPATPAAGTARVYVDSTSKNLAVKNDAGTVNHGIQTVTCSASNWVSASTAAGGLTCTQPAFSSLTGSATCAQLPALTGDTTSAGGTCATTVVGIQGAAAMRGTLVATEVAAPSVPPLASAAIWADSTNDGILEVKNHVGALSYTMRDFTCSTNNFATSSVAGSLNCTQPTFANLAGSQTCSQRPAQTGDATSAAGSCATSVVGVHDASGNDFPTSGNWTTGGGGVLYATTALGNAIAIDPFCNVNNNCPAGGDLGGSYSDPSVVALTESSGPTSLPLGAISADQELIRNGASHVVGAARGQVRASGTDTTSDYLVNKVTSSSGNIVVGTVAGAQLNLNGDPTKLFTVTLPYAFQVFSILNTGEAISGGTSPNAVGSIGTVNTEYPMGVAATTVSLRCYLFANHITGGTYTLKVAKNGVDTAVTLSYISSSVAGAVSVASATVASPSAFDRWGLDVTSVGTANSCGSSLCPTDLDCVIQLQP